MTFFPVQSPYEIFSDTDGKPLESGYIYIGEANQNPITNPISIFWDANGLYPAAQPIRTIGGYPDRNGSPSMFFAPTVEDYSLLINDKHGNQVAYVRSVKTSSGAIVNYDVDSPVNILWYGAKADGVTDDTAAFNLAKSASNKVYMPEGTYYGEFIIDKDDFTLYANDVTFYMSGGYVGATKCALLVTATNVTVHGDITVDGNVANNTYVGDDRYGAITLTGHNITFTGDILVQNSYSYGFTVYNGTNPNSGTSPTNIHLKRIFGQNCAFYPIVFWDVDGFSVDYLHAVGGVDVVTDERIYTGNASAASVFCENGRIGHIATGSTIETNTKNVNIDLMTVESDADNHKLENVFNVSVNQVIIEGIDHGARFAFAIADEFLTVGCEDIYINEIIVKNCTCDPATGRGININGVNRCTIKKICVIDCDYDICDFSIRDGTEVYIGDVVLDASGSTSTRGFLEEGGYTRENIVINNLVSKGHVTNDIELNSGEVVINRYNMDAVQLYAVVEAYKRNIIIPVTITVGATGDFASIYDAIQHVSEDYSSAFYSRTGINANPRVTIELQSGYTWADAIILDGIDLGFVTIKPAAAVTITLSGVINMKGINGANCPKIEGSYTKAGNGAYFINMDHNSRCVAEGITLIDYINNPVIADNNSSIDINGSSLTKQAAASYAATTAAAVRGGHLNCVNATVGSLEIVSGGIIYAGGSTIVGTVSHAVNTLFAAGIIFQ